MFEGKLRPFQEPAVERMLDRGQLLVAYDMGLGKLAPLDEPVLTPCGWDTMGALRRGDVVIGGDGRPTTVLATFPQGRQKIARVTFSDGTWSRCGWEHLWKVQHVNNDREVRYPGHLGGRWRVLTTRELSVGGVCYQNGQRKWRIPLVGPVEFAVGPELPVDPYLLGVLLGDGGLTGLTPFLSCAEPEILSEVRRRLPEGMLAKHKEGCDYSLRAINRSNATTPLAAALRRLGLDGCGAVAKFVPWEYMFSAPAVRLEVLRGLLDTDGECRQDGNITFSSCSEMLADGVAFLVRSLGGTARRRTRSPFYVYKGERREGLLAHCVTIAMPENAVPFKLTRKAERVGRDKYPPTRIIASIEDDGEEEAVCIKVDNSGGLYVTRDFIVTHNTPISIAAIEELMEEGVVTSGIVIATKSTSFQWKRQIGMFTDGARVLVVTGTPTERVEQYKSAWAGVFDYVILNYDQVWRDWKYVARLPRDFVICDEITAIKNFKAKRSKAVKKLKTGFRFGLTGQPIDNRPEELFSILQWIDPDVLGPQELFDKTFIVRNENGWPIAYKRLNLLHELVSEVMVRKTINDKDVRDQMPKVTEETNLIELDPASRRLYKHIARDLLYELRSAKSFFGSNFNLDRHYGPDAQRENQIKAKIMAPLLCLRMLCDHPELLKISARLKISGSLIGVKGGSIYAAGLMEQGLLAANFKTPKLDATVDDITYLLDASVQNKVVVFSFFRPMLKLISDRLDVGFVHFHGGLSDKARDEVKQRFADDPACRVFLSSDAGGVGIDLPQANYLINYDLPLSGGQADQRNARIIRLSSEWKSVTLLNELIQGSIEERHYDALDQKRLIASSIVDGVGHKNGRLELTLSTLTRFLEKAAV